MPGMIAGEHIQLDDDAFGTEEPDPDDFDSLEDFLDSGLDE